MSSVVRTICCCNGEVSDDEGPLINDAANDQFGTSAPSDSTDHFWVNSADSYTAPRGSSNVPSNFRQVNDEDELLNQILETTQQNIIDVANMDGTATPCKEDLTKAQRYGDAIRQHDLRVRKHGSNSGAEDLCLLADVGPRAVELLQQPAQPFTSFSELRDFAKSMSEAMADGIKIEHKQDILVHMSFTDE